MCAEMQMLTPGNMDRAKYNISYYEIHVQAGVVAQSKTEACEATLHGLDTNVFVSIFQTDLVPCSRLV